MTWNTIPAAALVREIQPLSPDTSLFRIELTGDSASEQLTFVPGQFFQLSVPGAGEAPFSPASDVLADGAVEFCIRKAGHVTARLHALQKESPVGIRGAFGTGFPVNEMEGHNLLLLAGGLGIAPLRSLLRRLLSHRGAYGSITLMYGAREPGAMLFRYELVELSREGGFKLMLTVDFAREDSLDGITCRVGLLPELLKEARLDSAGSYAVICGPPAMYGCLIGELEKAGFPGDRILLSLERRMKCGVGRCCHCAVGHLLCCTDGPVFRYCDLRGMSEL